MTKGDVAFVGNYIYSRVSTPKLGLSMVYLGDLEEQRE